MQKFLLKALLVVVFTPLFFTGCEVIVPEEAIKGEWNISSSHADIIIQETDMYTFLTENLDQSETQANAKIAEIEDFYVDESGTLTIAEDGTFTSTLKSTDDSGSWTYDSYTLTLNEQSIDVESVNNEVIILNITNNYLMELTDEAMSLKSFSIEQRIIFN